MFGVGVLVQISWLGSSGVFGWEMDKRILACQRFLKGLQSLPTFSGIREKQFEHLRGVIDKAASVPTEKAADLISSLDESIWNSEQLTLLKEGLSQKIGESSKDRRPMQDFTNFPRYLNEEWWNRIQTTQDPQQRLEMLTRFLGTLGLRCPNEQTVAAMVWYGIFAFRQHDATDVQKLEQLQAQKPRIKRWLQGQQNPAVYITSLPRAVEQCPQVLLQAAYPQGFQAFMPAGVNLEALDDLIRRFPLRKRINKHVPPEPQVPTLSSASSDLRGLGEVLAGLVHGQVQRQGSMTSSENPKGNNVEALVACEASTAPPSAMTELNVSARDVVPVLQDELPLQSGPALLSAEGQLETLRTHLGPGDSEGKPVLKRPAAKASGGATSKKLVQAKAKATATKKPAGKKTKAKAVSKPKKKVAAASSRGSSSDVRERLLAKIPKNVLQKYRNGCKSCRDRPFCCVSCWLKRGYSL